MDTLHFDKQSYLDLKQLYDEAVIEKREIFLFQEKVVGNMQYRALERIAG